MARTPGSSSEKTKQRILAAAEEIFLHQGYAGTSLQAIAERAGVTKGLIHHYFGSKNSLWSMIKIAQFKVYFSEQDMLLQDQPSIELVDRSFHLYFEFLKNHPKMLRLLWWSQVDRSAPDDEELLPLKKMFNELRIKGTEMVAQLQQQGLVRDDIDAGHAFAAFISLIRHWFVYREEYGLTQNPGIDQMDMDYIDQVAKVYIDGIKAKA